jgi:hypothetical protein
MGGTAEHADNFVPIDERLVSFFVSQNKEDIVLWRGAR